MRSQGIFRAIWLAFRLGEGASTTWDSMSKTFSSPPLPKKRARGKKRKSSFLKSPTSWFKTQYLIFWISDNIIWVVYGTSSPFSNKLERWKVLKMVFIIFLPEVKSSKIGQIKLRVRTKQIFSLLNVFSIFSGGRRTLENIKSIWLHVESWWKPLMTRE